MVIVKVEETNKRAKMALLVQKNMATLRQIEANRRNALTVSAALRRSRSRVAAADHHGAVLSRTDGGFTMEADPHGSL